MLACYQIDDVRNFLFGEPGDGAMDLVSLNLQRGRDHGIIHFNGLREALGLSPLTNFSEITSNEDIALALETLYETVDDVDPWVGNLCEVPSSFSYMFLVLAPDDRPLPLFAFTLVQDHISDEASFGRTLFTAFKTQFELLRDGDRFFYLNDPKLIEVLDILGLTLEDFENIKLSDIILMNTEIEQIQENVFIADTTLSNPCTSSPPADDDDGAAIAQGWVRRMRMR